jgi:UDP-N-acetylmuramoylalanine--D-glutamate ligase
MLALRSFEPGIVHAIMGGYDKKSDLTAMAQLAGRRCRAVYTVGATGGAIAAAAKRNGAAEVVECGDVDAAVAATVTRVHRSDVVLLSPGCASWDQFDNYEQRGAAFVAAVLKYAGEGSPNVPA